MDSGTWIVIAVVLLGLVFEFVNGFHDAANAIATVVATRVLTPIQATLMAGVLNLAGALAGTAVAEFAITPRKTDGSQIASMQSG